MTIKQIAEKALKIERSLPYSNGNDEFESKIYILFNLYQTIAEHCMDNHDILKNEVDK